MFTGNFSWYKIHQKGVKLRSFFLFSCWVYTKKNIFRKICLTICRLFCWLLLFNKVSSRFEFTQNYSNSRLVNFFGSNTDKTRKIHVQHFFFFNDYLITNNFNLYLNFRNRCAAAVLSRKLFLLSIRYIVLLKHYFYITTMTGLR